LAWPLDRRPDATLVGVKLSEILRLIGRDGWYVDRQRGSHRQYKHPTKRGLVTVAGKPSDDLHPQDARQYPEASWIERRRKPGRKG
jgi:predicted RNA binding protein YcfA (HicA-like mRNA interferase family)